MYRPQVLILYRQCLKNQRSWTPSIPQWREECREIRKRFERNKKVTDVRLVKDLLDESYREFEDKKHPDPIIRPFEDGGVTFERSVPPFWTEPARLDPDFLEQQRYEEGK